MATPCEIDYKERLAKREHIMDDVLDSVGCTPMVRLNRIPQSMGIECEVVVKCEFLNPGGSVKDRIGKNMLLTAEKSGRAKTGDTLIEATSGNTGLGLAMAAAVRGMKAIITMPEKMSNEKADVLTALGAQIYRTPTECAFSDYDSHIELAKRLRKAIPDSHILDQYTNKANPEVHYRETGEEIWQQCDGKVDYLVAGAGTGGTITGISQKLREKNPQVTIVGVDPLGSILAVPEVKNEEQPKDPQVIEGIGYDFIPQVLDRGTVDDWVKSNDDESFRMARRLIEEEGILAGGSSGTALFYALQYAQENKLGKDKRMVVILADGIRNYMTKHLQNEWMVKYKYFQPESLQLYKDSQLASVSFEQLKAPKVTVYDWHTLTVGEAQQLFKQHKVLPVAMDGKLKGAVHKGKFIKMVVRKSLKKDDLVKDKGAIDKDIAKFS